MSSLLRLGTVLFLCIPSAIFAHDKLIFAIDIIRHGDRTPFISLPSVDYHWQEGFGQLTAEGMQQEYNLGKTFRKKYIEQTHLLPDCYEQGLINVYATYFDRTHMSAQSLLMGLYPPGTGPKTTGNSAPALPHAFQPIPVFSSPAKYDQVIDQYVSHEERAKLMEQYVYSTVEWQQKNNELKTKYTLWSNLLGLQIQSLSDLQLLGDALYIHKIHHAPMPSQLSSDDIDTIIKASHWAFTAQLKPKQVATVYCGKLMTNIANYLDKGSQQSSKLKYVLLSAHDTTIAGALSFLGVPLEQVPTYASNLNFSLYESGQDYYQVKITYNGQPVSIPACGGVSCELQQFIKLVDSTKQMSLG
ncbi:histidine phosphatase family protein [Legionella sp. W05-934-2]|jgi:acid phosphatase|uniref:histidine phosphatase family protein n=1 Tax=Legionella sp. W05-934-2 TaxID=1198649 RepID=UPI003461DA6F